jgi:hypothetical protein
MRAKAGDDIRQSELIAESAPTTLSHFADFFTAIGKLGPVHTARHPLLECGCLENSSFSSAFSRQNKKLLARPKITQKNPAVLRSQSVTSRGRLECQQENYKNRQALKSALPPIADIAEGD